MKSLTLNVKEEENDKKYFEQLCNVEENIYNKLKEAEIEMNNSTKRYSSSEVENSMKSIINKNH